MTDKKRLWQKVFKIGCGVLVLALVGFGIWGYLTVNNIITEAKDLKETRLTIAAEFGEIAEFTPATDGFIPSDRMEAFLAVRDSMSNTRTKVEQLFRILTPSKEPAESANFFQTFQSGLDLVPTALKLISDRNRALMSVSMSPGEYIYIYSLAYYVMLGKSPSDGPPYVFLGPANAKLDGLSWQGPRENEDISKVLQNRELRIRKRTNGFLLQMLTNQLKAIDEETDQQENIDRAAWREMVAAELDTMKIDEGFRLLWESALPDPIVNSMEPFSTRLEASYGSLTNVVEMGMNQVE
jgi:hypothetical protein